MAPAIRRRSAALLILPLVFLLAGCIKFDSAMAISPGDQVDATILMAVQKQYGAMMREGCSPKGNSALPGGTVSPFEDDDYVGCTLSVRGVPLSQIAKSTTAWTVTHKGGQYSFGMANPNSAKGSPGMKSEMFTSFKAAFTFPGDVTSHSGSSTVEGTTVTWTDPDDLFTGKGLKATSKEASPLQTALPLVIGLVALIVVIGIAVLVWTAVRRRRAAKNAVPSSEAGTFALYY